MPKTTLLMMPLTMSARKSTAACMLPQNAPASMPISLHADQVGAEDAQRREQRRQQRHRDHAAPEPRRDDARQRVDRHHFHRRQLLGRLHQADLGGDRAAGAAREQQTGDDRPEFPHQRQRDQHAERFVGAVAVQHVVALQRQHHADEQAGHQDDDQRQHAGEVDLAQRQRAAGGTPPACCADDRDEEPRGVAQPARRTRPSPRPGGAATSRDRRATALGTGEAAPRGTARAG